MKVASAVTLASILTAAQAWHVKAPAAVQARHFGTSIPIPPPGEITSSIPLIGPSRTPMASSTPFICLHLDPGLYPDLIADCAWLFDAHSQPLCCAELFGARFFGACLYPGLFARW
ncbi:hypothetical protein N7523_001710 [Penicillium sp. IBT 18751x]|nr:hypothetical protein N7523_001710 [Penicillium sp. IBT 18751x]